MSAGQSLADGAAGVALLHLETGNRPAAHAALRHATSGGVSIAADASLFYGAPALTFVLTAADDSGLVRARTVLAGGTAAVTRRRLDAAHRRIDHQQQPHYAEYDLIRGLTGLGVTLRRLGDDDLLRQVLDYLVRLTEPLNTRPGWVVLERTPADPAATRRGSRQLRDGPRHRRPAGTARPSPCATASPLTGTLRRSPAYAVG